MKAPKQINFDIEQVNAVLKRVKNNSLQDGDYEIIKSMFDTVIYLNQALRARSKITLHFKRRCIPPGYVPKAQKYLDIPALSRLASQAPQYLKLLIYF